MLESAADLRVCRVSYLLNQPPTCWSARLIIGSPALVRVVEVRGNTLPCIHPGWGRKRIFTKLQPGCVFPRPPSLPPQNRGTTACLRRCASSNTIIGLFKTCSMFSSVVSVNVLFMLTHFTLAQSHWVVSCQETLHPFNQQRHRGLRRVGSQPPKLRPRCIADYVPCPSGMIRHSSPVTIGIHLGSTR